MYKTDKVAPLNLPLPFTWALWPFFSGHLTHPPRGEEGPPLPGRPMAVPTALPCHPPFPSWGSQGLAGHVSVGQCPCLWAGLFVFQEPVFSHVGHLPNAGQTTLKHLAWAASQHVCPAWEPGIRPSHCCVLTAAQQPPTRAGQGEAEDAGGGQARAGPSVQGCQNTLRRDLGPPLWVLLLLAFP